jgi:hypothetical protein
MKETDVQKSNEGANEERYIGGYKDKPDVTFSTPQNPMEVSHAMTIRVPDCQAAYAVLKSRGAEFLTPQQEVVFEQVLSCLRAPHP